MCVCTYVSFFLHLRDDGQSAPQVVQPQGCNVQSVNQDLPAGRLDDAEQAVSEARLPSSRPSDNANLKRQASHSHCKRMARSWSP